MDFTPLKKFQDQLVNWRIPGNDCIVTIGGREVYRYYCGYAEKAADRKIDGSELYYFWSASKPVTAALGMKLHESGAFLMTDPLKDYMPEFSDMKVRKLIDGKEEIVPAERDIKIGQLFNMTAGFDYNVTTPYIEEVRKETHGHCPTREIARAIAKNPLCFEPGERWNYSLCHDVLAAFIEVVAGKKLRDYAREVLFDPLGMDDTTYNLPPEEKRSRFAVQYNYRDDLGRYLATNTTCGHIFGDEYDSGGAGIVSSTADYTKFAMTLANNGTSPDGYRFLSPASVKLLATNTLTPEQLKTFNWSQLTGYGYGYGVRTMIDPASCGSLSPIGEFGWGGAAGVWVIIDPKNSLSLVYTQHMLNNQEPFISPRLRNILYSCL